MPVMSDWIAEIPGVQRDEPLAKHSQYGIGGPADWYVEIGDVETLADVVKRCHQHGAPVSVVGAGSNTLIADAGIRGMVVHLTGKSWRAVDETVRVQAAVMMPRLALDLAKQGVAGMEFGIGVPGTVGASVRGNAGAFGTEINDCLINCTSVGPDGEVGTHTAAECAFSYRQSAFKSGELRGHIVAEASFTVHPDDPAATKARTDAIQASRKSSQPYGIKSLGSVFTNPPGDHAGRLIEAAGLKGLRIGGAEISTKHANFIVNVSGATAADVLALANRAHDQVLEQFGVDLEREIVVMGEW